LGNRKGKEGKITKCNMKTPGDGRHDLKAYLIASERLLVAGTIYLKKFVERICIMLSECLL
jgi:hypothetical protein